MRNVIFEGLLPNWYPPMDYEESLLLPFMGKFSCTSGDRNSGLMFGCRRILPLSRASFAKLSLLQVYFAFYEPQSTIFIPVVYIFTLTSRLRGRCTIEIKSDVAYVQIHL